MSPTLLLSPAASGKTEHCIERVRALQTKNPLAPIRVILPDRNQASAFKRRLARHGGALGVEIGTFEDAYRHILRGAGQFLPLASDALTHRLTRNVVETLAGQGQLAHYAPIAGRGGLVLAVEGIIGELKRALIHPESLTAAVSAHDARLQDLARIYAGYQDALIALSFADGDGMGWLAIEQLDRNPALASDWQLLIVDGFDSFNVITLECLKRLSSRAQDTLVTLSGDLEMARTSYRRFAKTREQLEEVAAFEIKTLPGQENGTAAPLRHLERGLFEANAPRVAPALNVSWLEAQTIRLEAREALRWLKARVRRDGIPADECAVIARDLAPYRPFLREAADEFEMPLRFLGGEPLAQNPAIAALMDALELPQTWKRRALLDVLRSPYLDLSQFRLSRGDAARFAQVAQSGQVIQGLDQWREAFTHLADAAEGGEQEDGEPSDLPRGEAARALLRSFNALVAFVTPPAQDTLAGHVAWLQKRFGRGGGLDLAGQLKGSPTFARDASAVIAFRETLRAMTLAAQTANDVRPIGHDAFLQELRGALDTASYDPGDAPTRGQRRIYAGNMNTTRGIPYRAAVILGLSEGIFPAPESEDPFLSDADRAALHAQGLRLEPRLRGTQASLFYEAVTRAREYLLLTRPSLADDGETWQPSPYWEATRVLFQAPPPRRARIQDAPELADAASPAELLRAAITQPQLPDGLDHLKEDWDSVQARAEILRARQSHAAQGAYEGDASALGTLLEEKYSAAHVLSPSRLETFGACGFYFFIASALRLELVEPPTPGFDASQLGSLLHDILERVFRATPPPQDLDALLETLARVAPPLLQTAPDALGFRPTALWTHERAAILADLTATVRALHAYGEDFHPLELEARFGFSEDSQAAPVVLHTSAGEVRLRGTIDRVDENSAGELRIIDYKTGSSGFDKGSFVRGERLQLALYALAAQQQHPDARVVDGFYWHIRGAAPSSFQLSKFEHTDAEGHRYAGPSGVMALAQEHAGNFITRIRRGAFTPEPPEGGCRSYCPAKHFCWRYAPSRQ